jgi:hypothetical protein
MMEGIWSDERWISGEALSIEIKRVTSKVRNVPSGEIMAPKVSLPCIRHLFGRNRYP